MVPVHGTLEKYPGGIQYQIVWKHYFIESIDSFVLFMTLRQYSVSPGPN